MRTENWLDDNDDDGQKWPVKFSGGEGGIWEGFLDGHKRHQRHLRSFLPQISACPEAEDTTAAVQERKVHVQEEEQRYRGERLGTAAWGSVQYLCVQAQQVQHQNGTTLTKMQG